MPSDNLLEMDWFDIENITFLHRFIFGEHALTTIWKCEVVPRETSAFVEDFTRI